MDNQDKNEQKNQKPRLMILLREDPEGFYDLAYSARDLIQLIKLYTKDYDVAIQKSKKNATVELTIGIIINAILLCIVMACFMNTEEIWQALAVSGNVVVLGIFLCPIWIWGWVSLANGISLISKKYVDNNFVVEEGNDN